MVWNAIAGDGRTDVLWENTSTGERFVTIMNGTTSTVAVPFATLPPEWKIAGVGRLNTDPSPDILVQNTTTGDRWGLLMSGCVASNAVYVANVPTEWQIAAAGDFRRDVSTTLVWQNTTTGGRIFSFMSGGQITNSMVFATWPVALQVKGCGDFNGDGFLDLVVEHAGTGDVSLQLFNNLVPGGLIPVGTVPPSWQVAAVGDLNQDGKPDLIWQNALTGDRAVTFMNGTTVLSGISWVPGSVLPGQWQIVGTGDFDGDTGSLGMLDSWRLRYFQTLSVDPVGDLDGDGRSNLQEFQSASDPTDYFNGVVPVLSVVGGDRQVAPTNSFLMLPLTVKAVVAGANLNNAPVKFSVTQGGAQLAVTPDSTPGTTLIVRTSTNGVVSAYLKLGLGFGTNLVQVSANTGTNSTQVVFSEVGVAGNHPPVALARSASTGMGASVTIRVSGTDSDLDVLTYGVVSPPVHGTVSGTGTDFVYSPVAGYVGTDTFTYKANDGRADSAVATVTVVVRAPTLVSGVVNGQVWSESTSPYLVTGDLVVSNLTIDPGVIVLFQTNSGIKASGLLKVQGQSDKPVLFQPAPGNSNGWQGMVLTNALAGSVLQGCVFQGATRTALRLQDGVPVIKSCRFYNNRSTDDGGAIHATFKQGDLNLQSCDFTNNSAVYGGGAIKAVMSKGSLNVQDGVFEGNSLNPSFTSGIDTAGGAVKISGNSSFIRCRFQNNQADAYTIFTAPGRYARGGAVWCDTGTNSFRACSFGANQCYLMPGPSTPDWSFAHGGAMYQGSGVLNLINCLFTDQNLMAWGRNQMLGSAVYVSAGSLAVQNSTFFKNQAAPVIHNQGGTAMAQNSIFYFNNSNGPQISGSVQVDFSDVYGMAPGTGNIHLNPALDGQNRPVAPSPTIDAGNPAPAYNDTLFPPSLGSVRNDMGHFGGPGAIDWNGGAPVIVSPPESQAVALGRSATWRIVTGGDLPLSYQWQKNRVNIPGATQATYVTPPLFFADSGSTYRVIVSNGVGSITSPEAVLTVPARGPTPVGGTIAGQFWDASMSPVLVTNDLLINDLEIQPGVTIQFQSNTAVRVNGVIKALGTQSQPIVFQAAGTNSVSWQGLLFQNTIPGSEFHWCVFKGASNSALRLVENVPVIDHCSFFNNSSENRGGAIDLVLSKGDLNLPGCTFTNNTAFAAGGAISAVLSNGTFTADHCVFRGNMTDPAFTPYVDTQGGAVRVFGSSILTRCDFSNNQARALTIYAATGRYAQGGAIWAGGGTNSFRGCSFLDNACYVNAGPSTPDWSFASGGAVYQDSGILTLFNDLFARNDLIAGGRKMILGSALCVSTGGMYAANCSFIGNKTAPAVHNDHGGAEVVNSIFYFNNEVSHNYPGGWSGIYWQGPMNNWGSVPNGGLNLTGAKKLKFMARGETPGISLEFFAGGITGAYPDTLPKLSTGFITLTNVWKQYELDFTGKDLSRVSGGFGFVYTWADNAASNPTGWVFYVDNIMIDNGGAAGPTNSVPALPLPHAIYKEAHDRYYLPSGWMGDAGALQFSAVDTSTPGSGTQSIRVDYSAALSITNGWAGIYWQNPDDNWGTIFRAGYNLTGAAKVKFMARGAMAGVKVKFVAGGIAGPFPDTFRAETPVLTLGTAWQSYEINLAGMNLSDVIGGFSFIIAKADNPGGATFYLDDIVYDNGGLAPLPTTPPTPVLPFWIYKDVHDQYVPSGWMGNTSAMSLSDSSKRNPAEGSRCIKISYLMPTWDAQISGDMKVEYSDVQGGFNAIGNIEEDPVFDGSYRMLTNSPTVDAGNPASGSNDAVLPPAVGTSRNDMGHLGGPGAVYWQ